MGKCQGACRLLQEEVEFTIFRNVSEKRDEDKDDDDL